MTNTGLAWIRNRKGSTSRASTTLRTSGAYPVRYADLREKLETFYANLPEYPNSIAIEEPDLSIWKHCMDNPWPIFFLHGAYAVIYAVTTKTFPDSILHHLRPGSWKGGRPKEETLKSLKDKYEFGTNHPDDEVDALGLADFAMTASMKTFQELPADEEKIRLLKDSAKLEYCSLCGEKNTLLTKQVMDMATGKPKTETKFSCKECGPIFSILTSAPEKWIPRLEKIVAYVGRQRDPNLPSNNGIAL